MATPDNKLADLVDIVKSWIPRRTEPANLSRDFWMPDKSCRVCYECDSQFTVFNRRHHCRLCGRVFCAKCTANSVPAPSDEPKAGPEDWERIRVCNFCFKQWEQGKLTVDNGIHASSPSLSPSPSATSLASTMSSCTCNSTGSTVSSIPYSTGPYQHVQYSSGLSPRQSAQMDSVAVKQDQITGGSSTNPIEDVAGPSANQYTFCINRSDDEDDEYGIYQSDSETRHFSQADEYYDAVNFDEIESVYGPHKVHPDGDDTKSTEHSQIPENFDTHSLEGIKNHREEAENNDNGHECEAPPPYRVECMHAEPVDFNNGILWLPPEPEDEEDDREAALFDDEDDGESTGEWGQLHSSSSFGSGEWRSKDRSSEEHRTAMKNVVDGHFRALVAQLLQVENLPVGKDDDKESWLEIITSLSWEAATFLKPDTSKGGGMDPGGYVKVKCIACGHRSESMVVKGVVCKKNVAHRRMTSKISKPRFLLLGGALEYQRVSNHLSSFDTLLQQEMDHLKMAVAKINVHHPNVLLVEKSVSRFAQEYLLEKDISLVLNIKRPLLERISRCTGAQIVPSIDHLTSPKLGYCDIFHVEKFLEGHGSAGQDGKKLVKTLMFFEGCPKPLGCTILLKGANGDELKKVKHVIQYGVFAAYHLALETSFLADEGASLPELPLKSPITVALPDKPLSIDRSISTIPGFSSPATRTPQGSQTTREPKKSYNNRMSDGASSTNAAPICKLEVMQSTCFSDDPNSQTLYTDPASSSSKSCASCTSSSPSGQEYSVAYHNEAFSSCDCEGNKVCLNGSFKNETSISNSGQGILDVYSSSNGFSTSEAPRQGVGSNHADSNGLAANQLDILELETLEKYNNNNHHEVMRSSKEEFPPSPSNHQSILVSLSTRCVWKSTVCERAHLFRIKYYGSSDKPLGRFLREQLFDQSYCCRSCDMPSEAHVHCYTHRQGSLTISVKKLQGIALPGEREGKIWMWHRCLLCPRTNGFPPATRRVVMSDAAWGLSFGKFLELSFSNHAAASRVASCGHSLHRDCLRFYGFGGMVACFCYASIDVHSVYLPPPKLEFNSDIQEWIQKEADEVHNRAEQLFTEVYKALRQILEKTSGTESLDGMKAPESRHNIAELEVMLEKEKGEFEESLWNALHREVKAGQPAVDILEINRLQRQLVFHSYVWDQRLIYAASLGSNNLQAGLSSSTLKLKEKPLTSVEKVVDMNVTSKAGGKVGPVSQPSRVHKGKDMDQGLNNRKEAEICLSSSSNVNDQSDPVESGKIVRRVLSDGQDPVESRNLVRRVLSDGHFPIMGNLSDTLDAAWAGESHAGSKTSKENGYLCADTVVVESLATVEPVAADLEMENCTNHQSEVEVAHSHGSSSSMKGPEKMENSMTPVGVPFSNFSYMFSKNSSWNAQKLGIICEYNPAYVLSFRELEHQGGARLLLPVGVNETVVPVYDDEPTSIISYALVSPDYHAQVSNELERQKDSGESSVSLPIFENLLSLHSFDETASESYKNLVSTDENILSLSGSRSSLVLDPLLYTKDFHARVSFTDDGSLGKVKYTVTCYYAKQFYALRKTCCPSELDFIRSLSRCKKWGAQGGKSNVFFAKTLDDRFIIKQVTKIELESFIKFAPAYFKYLSESISTGSPTCLAKILGIYQVTSKQLKGGKESKMDVLVMENLLYRRNITRLYDLKGSSRSRYNPDSSGSNKVLLDQNLIEAMPTSPIFVGNKAKRLLERAVWNDTSFLASIDVMDYSLLVGVDEEKHELVLGIIDFMRQYTWDKHLETWVKASGILGGPKNTSPTVISPIQYKKRFRKAMSAYFLMVPDQWSPVIILPSGSKSDLCEENSPGGPSFD
ncbi:1-phosphatidylinositol-3-phosphate 5-kinase FAB1B isoform X2 [Vitis vinifera]|uniref:1-phosphatidylinositol-3-phosphate 5-kinase FAB1B isoform X2 n=1 Tax=Vitis vinifera TaxID=29760 RepID=UPI00053F6A77|nr:1-phosphatidylinositol-3-phosphate 5-kinase FAB1B isoform X2 [Vitis vinifera]XP_059596649.1 1-phosphatidylinositol-3-phosphate 5-kinase FAB1B isoform X2 [Vitis vinifera]|eukprot:XP_010656079.1 PREDICTED: 1-phosphatidylinositol-3-phosphate 5-kinase FAB1B isoform X2 [Vitis vinifera]